MNTEMDANVFFFSCPFVKMSSSINPNFSEIAYFVGYLHQIGSLESVFKQ